MYQGRFYEVASIIGYSTSSGDGRTRIIVSRAIACISSWLRLELEFVIRHAANQRSVADFMEIRMDRVRSDPVILSIVKISFSFFFQISFKISSIINQTNLSLSALELKFPNFNL